MSTLVKCSAFKRIWLTVSLFIVMVLAFTSSDSTTYVAFKYLVSDYVDNSDYVIDGRVLYIDQPNTESRNFNRIANVKVLKVYHSRAGDQPKNLILKYHFKSDLESMGMHFVTNSEYRIFATYDHENNLIATLHSGKFGNSPITVYLDDKVQAYFETGEDDYFYGLDCFYDSFYGYEEFWKEDRPDKRALGFGEAGCIEIE